MENHEMIRSFPVQKGPSRLLFILDFRDSKAIGIAPPRKNRRSIVVSD